MSKPERSQEPGRRRDASASPARDGWPPPGSWTPRAGGARVRRAPPSGTGARRVRVRAWSAAGRDRLAAERAELATLEQGIRFRTIFLILMGTILAIAASDVMAGAAG